MDTPTTETVVTAPEATPAPTPVVEAPKLDTSLPPEIAGRRAALDFAKDRWARRPTTEAPAAPAVEPPADPLPPAAEAVPAVKVVDALGNAHGEDGKFVEKNLPDTGEAVEPQAAATPPVEPVAEVPAAPEAPQTVRIQIPEGDLRRAVGGLAEADVPKPLEQLVRWAINNETRRQTVAERDVTIRDLKTKLAEKTAADRAQEKFKATPQYQAHLKMFNQLAALEESGEVEAGAAKQYWENAVDADYQRMLNGEVTQATNAVAAEAQAEAEQAAAEAWVSEAYQHTQRLPAEVRSLPEFPAWFDKAAVAFDANINAHMYDDIFAGAAQAAVRAGTDPNDARRAAGHRLFANHFLAFLKVQPSAQTAFQRSMSSRRATETAEATRKADEQRRIDAAAREAVEKAKRDAAAARTAAPLNPLASLPSTPRAATADREPEATPDANLSGFALEKLGRNQARAMAAKYTAGRR